MTLDGPGSGPAGQVPAGQTANPDPFARILDHHDLQSRYEVVRKLGQGGMGAVFEARDRRLKRRVALKLVLNATRDRIARFEREGEVLASLSHPRILAIFGAEVIDGTPVLVTEFLEGRTLKDDLARSGPYEPARAVDVALQVLEGLEVAHEKGIVHRDLKAENVLLLEGAGVKILDFGLASLVNERRPEGGAALTVKGSIMGTPAYPSGLDSRGHGPEGHHGQAHRLDP